MTDAAAPVKAASVPQSQAAGEYSFRTRLSQNAIRIVTGFAAVIPLLALGALTVVLIVKALPAIRYNGWGFIIHNVWNPGNLYAKAVKTGGVLHPVGASYGALSLIVGTLETSAIALLIAFPIAFGSAVLVVEKLPPRIASVAGVFLEVLAGIPSVVYGLWGILTIGPFLAHHVYPALTHLPNVPVLNIFAGTFFADGEGLLTAGIVLGVMIIPIMAAVSRDLLRQVPTATKEGAEALGMTSAESFRTVQLRWVRVGVLGAAILGLGRAIGETIAIAIVAGGVAGTFSGNIYGVMSTLAATIVNQLDDAFSDATGLEVATLAEAALLLLVVSLIVNAIARLVVQRVARGTALPIGAGF